MLRNTDFIIGLVLYVGTETKAHTNSKMRKRKQSWLIAWMHSLIYGMFIVIGTIVVILSIASIIFQSNSKALYLYESVSDIAFKH